MKKVIACVLSVCPMIASADYLDDKIATLTQQKLEKVEQLEKCQKAKGGLMAAGITTLGVSAIGIGANVAEAVKLNKLDGQIVDAKTKAADLDDKIEAATPSVVETTPSVVETTPSVVETTPSVVETTPALPLTWDDVPLKAKNQRRHHDKCTPEEYKKDNPKNAPVATSWIYSGKCVARSCLSGNYLVLNKKGTSDGWCRKDCPSNIGTVVSWSENLGPANTSVIEEAGMACKKKK